MSKLTRGLVIATTAATMFLAGCATQGTTDNGSGTTAPATASVAPKNSCKGMSQCKGMNGCKGKAKKAKKAKKKAAKKAAAKTDSTTATDSTAAK